MAHQLKLGRADAPAPLENEAAEAALLGKILRDDRLWYEAAELEPEDFSAPRHRLIFRGMQALNKAGRSIQPVILLSQIGEWDRGQEKTISAYVDEISAFESKSKIGDLLSAVMHAAGRRKLLKAGEEIIDLALTAPFEKSIDEIRASSVKLIESADNRTSDDAVSIRELVAEVIDGARNTLKSGTRKGISSGLRSFDELVGPMLPGQLIVIGGETGAGKTALATQIGVLVAEQNIPVHMVSMEMEGQEIAARLLAYYSEISAERLMTGELSEQEFNLVFEEGQKLIFPFMIESKPPQSVGTIQAHIARSQIKFGTKLGIIDHLQFERPDNTKSSEHEQIRQCVDDTKAMAKRLGIPIILLSHVSRISDPEAIRVAADIKRPTLRHLYGSSAIEKAADAVVFVHRPAWHLERATGGSKEGQRLIDLDQWKGKAELVLPKRRGGKGHGIRTCQFDEERTWFHDL